MPIYTYNGEEVVLTPDRIEEFESQMEPLASEIKVMFVLDGDKYAIPLNLKNEFQNQFKQARYYERDANPDTIFETPVLEDEEDSVEPKKGYTLLPGSFRTSGGTVSPSLPFEVKTPKQRAEEEALQAEKDKMEAASATYNKYLEDSAKMPTETESFESIMGRVSAANKGLTLATQRADVYGGWADKSDAEAMEDLAESEREWEEQEKRMDDFDEAAKIAPDSFTHQMNEERLRQQLPQFYDYLSRELNRLERSTSARHAAEVEASRLAIQQRHGSSPYQMVQYIPTRALRLSAIEQLRHRLNIPTKTDAKSKDTWVEQVIAGAKAGTSWSDILTAGWGDLVTEREISDVLRKMENGESLTPEEQEVFDIMELRNNVEGYISGMRGATRAANVGYGAAASVPYMAGFAIGSPIGGALSTGLKTIAKPLAGKIIKGGAKNWIKEAVEGAAKAAFTVPFTSQAGLTYEQLTQEQYFKSGQLNFDAEGNLSKWAPTSKFERLYKSGVSSFLENFSELTIGNLVGAPLNQAMRKVGNHLGLGGLYGVMDNNALLRTLHDQFGWNGTLGEFVEELFVNFTEPLATLEPEQLVENFKAENLWETFLVVATIGSVSNAAAFIGQSPEYVKYGQANSELKQREKSYLKGITDTALRQQVYTAMQQPSITDMSVALADVAWDGVSRADAASAMNYVRTRLERKMLNSTAESEADTRKFSEQNADIARFVYTPYAIEGEFDQNSDLLVTAELNGRTYVVKSGDYAGGNPKQSIVIMDKSGTPEQVALGELNNIQEWNTADYLAQSYADIAGQSSLTNAAMEAKEDAEIAHEAGIEVPMESPEEVIAEATQQESVQAEQPKRSVRSFSQGDEIVLKDGTRAIVNGKDIEGYTISYEEPQTGIPIARKVSYNEVDADASVPVIDSFDETINKAKEIAGVTEVAEKTIQAITPEPAKPEVQAGRDVINKVRARRPDSSDEQVRTQILKWKANLQAQLDEVAEKLDSSSNEADYEQIGQKEDELRMKMAAYDAAMELLGGEQPAAVEQPQERAPVATDKVKEVPQTTDITLLDPRTMPDEEKQRRGDMLRNAPVVDVKQGTIVSTAELSARKAAEKWWDENVGEAVLYDTEVGEVEINRNSIESSLAHRYGQKKLDALTSLVEGFENAVYLGTMEDGTRQDGVLNHYFAYPIIYNGALNYVFCRAMQDANKNRLYVHEVFLAENVKKGDTLQTAASQPHGGISLYRDILANVLSESKDTTSVPENQISEQEVVEKPSADAQIEQAEQETNPQPTEAQKEAGNYKKGHIKIDGFDITIETPKGVVRSGVDEAGNAWSVTMNNTYGYIRGTEGVDGDHIDLFLSDNLDGWNGNVYVIDQVKPDGSFDEHKVMYGFNTIEEAQAAYLSNYSEGWQGLGSITGTTKEEFQKWVASSHRKTKPFVEYKSVKTTEGQAQEAPEVVEEATATRPEEVAEEVAQPSAEDVKPEVTEETTPAESDKQPEQEPQRDNFEEAVANQGYIERKPAKSKFSVWEFVAGKEVRPSAKIPTILEGVYYDKGFRVATDGKVLVKEKNTAYPAEYEGTARMRDGARTDEGVKYPPYERVIPAYKQADSRKIDFADLLGFLNAVKERVTAEHKATNQHRSLLAALNNTPISMRLANGQVVSFSLAKLMKFALAAKQIGADRLYGDDWTRAILAKNKNGELALLIPVRPDVYPYEGSTRYYYAPELETKPEPNKAPTEEVEEEKNAPTETTEGPTPTAQEGTSAKIEDFGEKIGGARKDVARQRIKDSMAYSRTDLVNLKDPDKILSRANIIKYVREGEMTIQDATTLLALNMAVRGEDLRKGLWLEKYRDAAFAWSKGQDVVVEVTDKDVDEVVESLGERARQRANIRQVVREGLELTLGTYTDYKTTYEALNYPEVNRMMKSVYIRVGRHDGKYWVVASPKASRGWPYATMSQAVAKMQVVCPVIPEEDSSKGKEGKDGKDKIGHLHIVKDERGYYRIKSRNIPGSIYLSKRFNSKKVAEQYLKDNAQELVQREIMMTAALMGSNIGMVERQGPDYRNGRDVTPQDFLDTFGVRGVEFGNWVPQAERQLYLNKSYDAIMDLCKVVGISPKAFSLGGRLALAFGSRGKSRALAHYEPLKEVINLTRMKGAGSLAHEWFHALDNYLSRQVNGNVGSMTTRDFRTQRSEVAQEFRTFVHKMGELAYSRRSSLAGPYWYEVWERAARLFESYVYNKLAEQNIESPLLVREDSLYDESNPLMGESGQSAWPYPSAEENEVMKPYFDTLFDTIQEREENGKAVLYQIEDSDLNTAEAKMSTEEVLDLVKAAGIEVEIATPESISAEEQEIIAKAKANGTYLKAPNGKPTNLTPRQWVQVRTKAFKRWFGDWEIGARIIKLIPADINHGFKNIEEAKVWAKNNIAKTYTEEETGGKGNIRISKTAVDKYLSKSSIVSSENLDIHLATLRVLPKVIREGIDAEQHPDYNKGADGVRRKENGYNPNVTIHRVYGAINIGEDVYRVKVTLKEDKTNIASPTNAYSYEAVKIELLAGQNEEAVTSSRNSNNSIQVAKLLNGVEKSYDSGEKIINSSKVVDANGEPLVVYHGSNWKGITTFDRSQSKRRRSGLREYGHFFTTNRALAEMYAAVEDAPDVKEEIDSLDAQIEQAAEAKDIGKMLDLYTEKERITRNLGGRVYEVFLNLRDVAEFDADYQADKGWYNLKADVGYKTAIGRDAMEAYAGQNSMTGDRLRKDGIIGRNIIDLFVGTENKEALKPYYDKYGGDVFLVFDPQNIKSASENEGTFDTNNPDIRYLRGSSEGEVYGWMSDGKIYLTEKGLNPETPIHEYTHIWDAVCQKENSELWAEGVALMKQTPLWEQVRTNPAYADIANNENALASEVHARLVAPGGTAILVEMMEQQKVEATLIGRIHNWLRKFWRWLRKKETPESKLNVDKFARMPLKDLAMGKRLDKSIIETNSKQKVAGKETFDIFGNVPMAQIGRRRQEEMYAILAKRRQDLSDAEKLAVIVELDKLDNNKLVNAAFQYFANGTVRLPEDMPKVEQAVKVAEIAKVDPAAYKSPMELINAHADVKLKEARIDPDTVPTLSNKVEYEDGLAVYDVEDSEESRQNMRRIINTHFGEDSSPWCLLQGDGKGNLTDKSARYWIYYDAQPKRVAFQNGKLLAFFASDGAPTWWDRQDAPHFGGIPAIRKLPDGSGRVGTVEFNEATREWGEYTNIRLGQRGDKIYEEWFDEDNINFREIREGDIIYAYDWGVSGIFSRYTEMDAGTFKTIKTISWYEGVVVETVADDNVLYDYERGRISRIQELGHPNDVVEWNDNSTLTYVKDRQNRSVWFDENNTVKLVRDMDAEGSASFLVNYEEGTGRLQRCTLVSEDGVKTFVSWNSLGLQQYRVGEEAVVMIGGEVVEATEGFSELTSSQAEQLADKVKQEVEQRVAEYVKMAQAKAAEWEAKAGEVRERYSDSRSFEQQGERQLAAATSKERYREAEETAPVEASEQKQLMADAAKALADKLHTPIKVYTNVEDITDPNKLRERRRRSTKGWWNEDGSIGINLSMHNSVGDIEATILHEVVGHKGLREVVGSDNEFNALLDKVWDGMTKPQQERWSQKYSDKYEAAEEYMATLAEGKVTLGVVERIVGWARRMFDKVFGVLRVNDQDIVYLLWLSRNRLTEAKGAAEKAEVITKGNNLRAKANRFRSGNTNTPLPEQMVANVLKGYMANRGLDKKLLDGEMRKQFIEKLWTLLPGKAKDVINAIDKGKPYEVLDKYLSKADNGLNVHLSLRGLVGTKEYDILIGEILPDYVDEKHLNNLVKRQYRVDLRKTIMEDAGAKNLLYKGNPKATFEDTGLVGSNKFVRKLQDSTEPVKKLQELATKSFGIKITAINDAYNALNQWTSKAKVQVGRYEKNFVRPLLDLFSTWQTAHQLEYDQIVDYITFKSALERHNSGFPTFPVGEGVEEKSLNWNVKVAESFIAGFEKRIPAAEIKKLWDMVNAANKYVLDYLVESGNLSPEVRDKIRGHRWKYYVPMMGWDLNETQNIDATNIYDFGDMESLRPKAISSGVYIAQIDEGRATKPANPIANMLNMGYRSIMAAENNKMKQKVLALAGDIAMASTLQGKHSERIFETSKRYMIKDIEGGWRPMGVGEVPDAEVLEHSKSVRRTIKEFERTLGDPKISPTQREIVYDAIKRLREEESVREMVNGGPMSGELPLASALDHLRLVDVYVNGVKQSIRFADPQVAMAINGTNIPMKSWLTRRVGNLTRITSGLFTSYSPSFVVANMYRDIRHAFRIHLLDSTYGGAKLFARNLPKTFGALVRGTSGKGQPLTTEEIGDYDVLHSPKDRATLMTIYGQKRVMDTLYDVFKEGGGVTGYVFTEDVKTLEEKLRKEAARNVKRASHPTLAKWSNFWSTLNDYYNVFAETSESISRFGTFLAALESGKDTFYAVQAAKDITVNFNRKGELSQTLGSWYMFFNASVQAAAQEFKVAEKNKGGFVALAITRVFAGILNGMLIDWALRMLNDDDDDERNDVEIPLHVRLTNMVLPIFSTGKYVKLPYSQGSESLFNSIGVYLYEVIAGRMGLDEAFGAIFPLMFDTYSPLAVPVPDKDFTKNIVRMFTPSIATPVLDILQNRDAFGRPVHRERYSDVTPAYQLGLADANNVLRAICQAVNWVGGGSKVKGAGINDDGSVSGIKRFFFEWNPSDVQHILEYFAGGSIFFGKYFWNTINTIRWALGDEDINITQELPIMRRFLGEAYIPSQAPDYYALRDRLRNQHALYNSYMEDGIQMPDNVARDEVFYRYFNRIDKAVKRQRELVATKEAGTKEYEQQWQKLQDLMFEANYMDEHVDWDAEDWKAQFNQAQSEFNQKYETK